MTSQLSAKACICVAHLMLLQNPKAVLKDNDTWLRYLNWVRNWCSKQEIDGVRYYFHAQPGDLLPRRILQ